MTIRDLSIEGEKGEHQCTTWTPPRPRRTRQAPPPRTLQRARIYGPILGTWTTAPAPTAASATTATPSGASFSAEYKLAILAEYDACSESGEKGAILRREGLYSSLITDWRRQHRQGLLKAGRRPHRRRPRRPQPQRGGEAPSGERTAPQQAGPGRGDHRGPGKSARALGGDLEERGPRRRHLTAIHDAGGRRARRRAASTARRACAGPRPLPRQPLPAPPASRCTARPHPGPGPTGPSHPPRPTPSSRRSTANGSATRPPPRSGPPCSTKAPTWRRSPPCTGCCADRPRSANDAPRPAGPPRSSPNWSPPAPTRCGPGTSPSSAGPHKWTWFQLYVILDVYCRYVVAWLVAPRESARLAEELIADAIYDHRHPARATRPARRPGQLDDLQDRHPAPRRPRRPAIPHPAPPVQRQPLSAKPSSRPSSTPRRSRNASPASTTPAPSATGSSTTTTTTTATPASASTPPPTSTTAAPTAIRAQRQTVLDAAYTARPERFRRPPTAPRIPEATWINQPEETAPDHRQPSEPTGVSPPLTRTDPPSLSHPPGTVRSVTGHAPETSSASSPTTAQPARSLHERVGDGRIPARGAGRLGGHSGRSTARSSPTAPAPGNWP